MPRSFMEDLRDERSISEYDSPRNVGRRKAINVGTKLGFALEREKLAEGAEVSTDGNSFDEVLREAINELGSAATLFDVSVFAVEHCCRRFRSYGTNPDQNCRFTPDELRVAKAVGATTSLCFLAAFEAFEVKEPEE